MHILSIPSWYKTQANPTRGHFFYGQAVALQKAGYQTAVLVPPSRLGTMHGLREVARHWRQPSTAITVTEDAGIVTYRIPWWGWWGNLSLRARGALALQGFDQYCREQGVPDVLHAHSVLYGGCVAAYIKQQRGIPVVLTEHSSALITGSLLPGQPGIIRQTLPYLDHVLAVGPSLAEALAAYAPGQCVEVLGNAVDTVFFTPADTPLPASPFYFLLIANLDRNKGVDVLLDAFAVFRGAPVHLRIAGRAQGIRAQLARQADRLGISSQVEFLGMQSREGVRDLLRQSHVVVSASHTETFGVTLIEGMACGKPVVATRSGGPQSFVTPQIGLLVPPGDSAALSAAMQHMVQANDRYDPAYIRGQAVEQFSEGAIVSRLEAIYQGLIAKSQ